MTDNAHLELVALMDRNFRELRKAMKDDAEKASESRRAVYQELQEQRHELQEIRHEQQNLRAEFDAAKPALRMYRDVKGAGRFGRGLYRIGVVVIGGAALLAAKWESAVNAWRALTGK